MAESRGFEPLGQLTPTTAFQAVALGHSANSPYETMAEGVGFEPTEVF